jgi:hypothetical protein
VFARILRSTTLAALDAGPRLTLRVPAIRFDLAPGRHFDFAFWALVELV